MNKYHYSAIRFVPSPVRGEFVNLGLIVGCDATGEWSIDIASSRSRAAKLDDLDVFPIVAADLQRLQSDVESYSDPDFFATHLDLSEEWLWDLARNSQNLLQFSSPKPVLAESADSALAKLWPLLVVEPTKAENATVTKSSVLSRYWFALEKNNLKRANLMKRAILETSKTHASVDVVTHNGVVKDITQCWSLQVKNPERIMDDIKAWGWTMKTLRDHGGTVRAGSKSIEVPANVRLGVVYAPSDDPAVSEEAIEIFQDKNVKAIFHTLERVEEHAISTARLLNVK